MFFIRQNATHKVVLGPAVAVGDGFTPVTNLAVSTADEAEAILHDNGTVVDISGYTWAAIATADGYYHLTLQSGISGTVGHLTIVVNDDSLCLPLRADFTVLEEGIYDSLFAAAAAGFDTNQRVNVGQWLGTAVTTSATTTKPEVDAYSISDDATAANNAELAYDGTGYGFTGCTMPTVTTLTGHTAQTGDSFARIGAAGASLTDLGGMSTGMKAEINAEALDVINTDTFAEPGQEVPTSTTTIVDKIGYLYKAWRNKCDQSSSTYQLYADDASTVDQQAAVSEAAGTVTRGEVASGA